MRLHNIITAILIAAALTACSGKETSGNGQVNKNEEQLPTVEVLEVRSTSVPQIGEYTATVEAFKTNNISTSTPNRIKQILVDVGAHVAAGQKVVVLDDVNIEQLKVRLDNTERDYDRAVELLNIGGGTRQAVDQLKTELDAARRQYANMVENTILTSPSAGVVTARNYDPGDMTGQLPILTIEQVQPVKVIVNVSESEFSKVHNGMEVDVTTDVYPDRSFKGKVYLIHPTIDAATRTFTVEITLPNTDSDIVPGMFARVTISFGEADHVVVPDRAVVKQPGSGNKYVYVYHPDDRTVSYNLVQLGRRIDNSYEVLSGVDNGAQVVIAGQSRLTNGAKVELAEK